MVINVVFTGIVTYSLKLSKQKFQYIVNVSEQSIKYGIKTNRSRNERV
jgi:hypothetical protein